MTNNIFDIQDLTTTSEKWKVNLHYESWNATNVIKQDSDVVIIDLSDKGQFASSLRINVSDKKSEQTCILTGIQGGTYLYTTNSDENSQTVKIDNDDLILSLGFSLVSINLNKLKLNWKLEPDMAEIFEFYDLNNDYLLRGEIGIHRIDKNGLVKWTFSARDIWVSMEGKPEVEIYENSIKLLDFNSDVYVIDFDGKEIKKLATTTYKNNGGITAKTKDNNNNKLWSKLKRLWS